MRYSRLMIPTLKELPADAVVVSHILMLRAGMIRKPGRRNLRLSAFGQEGHFQGGSHCPRGNEPRRSPGTLDARRATR